jgi:hypothetical protein
VIGALEAFLKARGSGGLDVGEPPAVDVGNARIHFPTVSSRGSHLQINLVRVTF